VLLFPKYKKEHRSKQMRVTVTGKIKAVLATVALGLTIIAGIATVTVALPSAAYAAVDTTSVCTGVTLTGGACNGDASQFTKVIKLVVQILSFIAGVAAVIMIVVGGLRYITSGGDSSKVAGAKQAILYAIVGLIVVALAQFIVRFVLTNATK
jgi:hypothetical protein